MTLFIYLVVYIFIIFTKTIVFTKEIIINHDNFYNLKNIINASQNDGEIVLKFVENYYNMTYLNFDTEITVLSNISFIGNDNGTIFDYNNKRRGALNFKFVDTGEKIKYLNFHNIIYENLMEKDVSFYGINVITIQTYTDKVSININNCTFRNNHGNTFQLISKCMKTTYENPSIVFNNCTF